MLRIPLRESGLIGSLFLPEERGPFPLVITLGGFRGGMSEGRAELLAAHGFAALALAYFGCEGLPPSLREIPLEYFERAIDWAVSRSQIDPDRIGLWGVSRGAELALLLGAFFPEKIRAIVATVPSSVIYGSIQSESPAWIYRNRPIGPSASLPVLKFDPTRGKNLESAIALTPYFLEGMKNKAAFHAAQIPVEKIRCPLLLISGKDDQMWPSALFARQIERRLKIQRSSIPCSHYSYPGAGHSISSSDVSAEFHPIVQLWFSFGGIPEINAAAKADAWNKTQQFFEISLAKVAISSI